MEAFLVQSENPAQTLERHAIEASARRAITESERCRSHARELRAKYIEVQDRGGILAMTSRGILPGQ